MGRGLPFGRCIAKGTVASRTRGGGGGTRAAEAQLLGLGIADDYGIVIAAGRSFHQWRLSYVLCYCGGDELTGRYLDCRAMNMERATC
jgi:hypothetical protein